MRPLEAAGALRKGPNDEAVAMVAALADDLGRLAELVRDIRISALGRKDWSALADLLQYEIHPLPIESRNGFADILGALK